MKSLQMNRFPVKTLTACMALVLSALLIAGCDSTGDDGGGRDDNFDPAENGRFVITASPTAVEGVADYLLVADDLTDGSVSTIGGGIEQDGEFRYYITDNEGDTFYSLLYGRGNPGRVTAYEFGGDSTLTQLVDFQAETVQAFTTVDDEILTMAIPRGSDDPVAEWFRLDTETSQIVGDGQFNTQDIIEDDNDELAHFSWMTQVGDQVWAPFFSIKGCCDDGFGTNNPNTAWIAVFSYPEMELQRVIEDDRTSFIGRYFTKGLSVDENGDVYAFSSSVATNNGELASDLPSAITRVNEGATDFDEDYYFNVQEASGGDYYLTNHIYAGDGNALLYMQPVDEKGAYTTGQRLAVVNVYDQTFAWVDGAPSEDAITSVSTGGASTGYVSDDGETVYVGLSTESESHVYAVDMDSATATQGLEVEGGTITSIDYLEYPE